ncbi:glycine oxidase ThiO [Alicyclobacillus pomorum]|jgi:glycine oxidase
MRLANSYDVIVVGGGAIGSAIAWRLGQTGRKVLLLERGQIGQEASSAAAGMLGAQLEVKEPGPFYHLCLESRSLYPRFSMELFEETGIDIEYTRNGILQVATCEGEVEVLQERMRWQTADGGRAEWIPSTLVAELEPALAPVHGALFLPEDGNVFAPRVACAVGVAAKKRCTVLEGADVTDIQSTGTHVVVHTPTDSFTADTAVVAAGAWADKILQGSGVQFGIAPVKGQLFSIRPTGNIRLTKTVFSDDIYLVPKRNGSIVVGATEEHGAGYNRTVTMEALHELFSRVQSIAPGLSDAQFERAWSGLRPGSATGFPAIGPIPGHPRIHVAVGHFRNGILLTPLTAKMVVHSIEGNPAPELWSAFRPEVHLAMKEGHATW